MNQPKYFDSHMHIKAEDDYKNLLSQRNIQFMASSSTIEEVEFLQSLADQYPNLHYSCGIHPWNADKVKYENMLPYLEACPYLGEIGMDNYWCKVDLSIQKQVFTRQLNLAQAYAKPVILHTKGCEEEISQIIAAYSMPVLVHWYDCPHHLEDYLARGCYFTIGPSLKTEKAIQQMVKKVPASRLMLETDGLSALEWGLNCKISPLEITKTFNELILAAAEIKNMPIKQLENALYHNSLEFFGL